MYGVEVSTVYGVEVAITVLVTMDGDKNCVSPSMLDGSYDAGVSSITVMLGVGCCCIGVSSIMFGDLSVLASDG